jgi:hypothetical protein
MIFVVTNARDPGREQGMMSVYITNPTGAARGVIKVRSGIPDAEQARLLASTDPLGVLLDTWVQKTNSTGHDEIAEMLQKVSNDAAERMKTEISVMFKPA